MNAIIDVILLSLKPRANVGLVMCMFLIVSIPLWFLLIVSFYRLPSRGWRGLLLPFLGGLVTGMGALSLTLSVLTRTPFGMDFSQLFLWAWIRGPGMAGFIVTAIVTAVSFRRFTSYSRIREISAWFGGTAFCYLIWLALTPSPGFDGYRVLLAPFVWIGAFGSSVWLADRGLRSDGWVKIIFLICAAVFPTLFTFVPVAYAAGAVFIAWPIAVLFAAGSVVMAFVDSRGRFS